ncbi:helix-turn-helix transcriptional regulator [Nocardia aurantiaca]|uniref:Helix-turn-helix domain-containing protein n=1 Tax=Nocardia aurantiaca TaxID=2675850 RepID=A0A6I3L602_9NOCA|nr:helix-turn-helix transcriptional regulator [Nocardia aurantiaca]MTE16370.1 helix-turn-helix domain-containing protein [Nocardia aurantiaca]
MDTAAGRRDHLREFLRGRRARITPDQVGLPVAGRRRTPGLRREEVAVLAGVGVSWYTWLEQGRDITVSAEVLDAIAAALLLTDPERAHLYILAGLNPPCRGGDSGPDIAAETRNLLDAWGTRPAVLRDRYWNVLAYNDTARAVFGFEGPGHNCLVTYFTNPRYLAVPDIWAEAAPAVAAAYRADSAPCPDDPGFGSVVTELASRSPEFARLWSRHDVGPAGQAVNALRHPEVGDLHFDATTLLLADQPDRHMVLYNPRPDTGTADRLDQIRRLRLAPPA